MKRRRKIKMLFEEHVKSATDKFYEIHCFKIDKIVLGWSSDDFFSPRFRRRPDPSRCFTVYTTDGRETSLYMKRGHSRDMAIKNLLSVHRKGKPTIITYDEYLKDKVVESSLITIFPNYDYDYKYYASY